MHRRRVASPSQTAPDTNIVHTLLRSLVSSEPPVSQGDPSGSADWVEPKLIARVRHAAAAQRVS
jgi:hypothetical protein